MLMLVDAPGLWFRSYYALPSSLTAPDGTPTNALRGFCDGLATLIRRFGPDRLICAVDNDWRPQWRVDLLATYKTHRVADDGGAEEAPDDLTPQVDIITELMHDLGIPMTGADDYEADDVLASLAAHADEPVLLVTGDRDLFQTVDDTRDVRVVYIGRGLSKAEAFDDTAVRDRFGVPAAQYVDFAALRGDPSDGIPGVKGIGEKTAASLLGEYGDLTTLRAAANDPGTRLPTRARNALRDAGDYLDVAPRVIRTATDIPVSNTALALPHHITATDRDEWSARYGIQGPLTRLGKALSGS